MPYPIVSKLEILDALLTHSKLLKTIENKMIDLPGRQLAKKMMFLRVKMCALNALKKFVFEEESKLVKVYASKLDFIQKQIFFESVKSAHFNA